MSWILDSRWHVNPISGLSILSHNSAISSVSQIPIYGKKLVLMMKLNGTLTSVISTFKKKKK